MDLVLTADCFANFVKLIHKLTGISVAANRTSMVEGRLKKRVASLNLRSYDEYLSLVQKDVAEQVYFIDLVTTNETYFYRTPRIWKYLEERFLPSWHALHPKTVFTAWSAAASSGEEAHTLGILCQALKDKSPSFSYQIYGTDISSEMIGMCREGKYGGRSIEVFKNTRPDLFEPYMQPISDDSFEVIPEIKNRLRFQTHNLFLPSSMQQRFDLVLVRNVLIYFQAQDQEKVASLIEPKMAEDGILIIGESESLTHIKTKFKSVESLIYTKNLPSSNLAEG